jgi:hypothetical protein
VASNDKTGPSDDALEGSWSPRRSKASSSKAKGDSDSKPDTDELVEDIERTRAELAETLDAIADKVSPKRVVGRTKKAAKDGANDAVESVKETAGEAAEAVKGGVAAVKEKVAGDAHPVRSPLGPATKVEIDSATVLPGAEVPFEPAPTPGALADAAYVAVEPVGAEPTSYTSTLPPAAPSRMPMLAGAGAALVVLLVLLKRRKR